MKKWMLKSWLQRVLSWLPWSYWWNEQLQKHVTSGLDLRRETFEGKVDCCRQHLEHYRQFSPRPAVDFRVLEVGTGWFPIIPVGLFLCGAARVHTYDIVPLLRPAPVRRTLQLFSEAFDAGRLAAALPGLQPERMILLRETQARADQEPPTTLLQRLQIEVQVGDARQSNLPDGSVDLIFSNFVLEHLPRELLLDLLGKFRRLLSPNGVMSHYVGLADQYAGFDSSITPFNFLRYSARSWRWLNNPIINLNRLRITDYRAALQETGHRLVKESSQRGSPEALRQVPLAPEFRRYPEEDLLVLYSWLVTRPG